MDYEKKYNDALKRAKAVMDVAANQDEARGIATTIFPELLESEEERIRKKCIELIKRVIPSGDSQSQESKEILDCIAYLEKQKEQKWSPSEGEMRVLYKLCYLSEQITDEDDTELTRLYQDLKREYFNGHSFENMFSREKQKEQKPRKFKLGDKVHWHGDDVNIITITGFRDDAYLTDSAYGPILFSEEDNWEIVEQKPAEWSEEDEKMRNLAIEWAETMSGQFRFVDMDSTDFCKITTWLKSIRPQPHWKPSEEQMEWLESAVKLSTDKPHIHGIIISLYEQLKRL